MKDPVGEPVKRCFMIAPIGLPNSDTRRRSDKVLRHIVRPIVEEFNYQIDRADDIDHSGQITSQVIDRIASDDLVIADLTDLNPNVFYELALRHALRKPFIQIAEAGQVLPFDIQNQRTILVDHRDLDSVAEAKERIRNSILSIESGAAVETPMSFALNLQDLRGSADPEEKGIAQLIESVGRLEARLLNDRSRSGSHLASDFSAMRGFIERLGKDGRLTNADIFELMSAANTSKSYERWVASLEAQQASSGGNFDEEPPF
ncbi:hypothetical protein ACFO0M_30350 [Micromonospora mangrovi]|uniref:Nucleoside 2-deoxyribosyltransferase n=2 Tax=Micromonospora TaxID=1873 RepID=A0AAU7M9C7_9ACTN